MKLIGKIICLFKGHNWEKVPFAGVVVENICTIPKYMCKRCGGFTNEIK